MRLDDFAGNEQPEPEAGIVAVLVLRGRCAAQRLKNARQVVFRNRVAAVVHGSHDLAVVGAIQDHVDGRLHAAMLDRVADQVGEDLADARRVPVTVELPRHLQPDPVLGMKGAGLGHGVPRDLGDVRRFRLHGHALAQPGAGKVEQVADQGIHLLAAVVDHRGSLDMPAFEALAAHHVLGRHGHRAERIAQVVPQDAEEDILRFPDHGRVPRNRLGHRLVDCLIEAGQVVEVGAVFGFGGLRGVPQHGGAQGAKFRHQVLDGESRLHPDRGMLLRRAFLAAVVSFAVPAPLRTSASALPGSAACPGRGRWFPASRGHGRAAPPCPSPAPPESAWHSAPNRRVSPRCWQ